LKRKVVQLTSVFFYAVLNIALAAATPQPMSTPNVNIDELVRRLWRYHHVYDDFLSVDLVVCLGSYDLRVAERCAELLKAGTSHFAVVTGGLGNWTKGVFKRPEAEITKRSARANL
jgi:hypothetical protein